MVAWKCLYGFPRNMKRKRHIEVGIHKISAMESDGGWLEHYD